MEILRKITTKTMSDLKPDAKGGTFYGRANDYQVVQTIYGPAVKFIGDFRLLVEGEEAARASALYLPRAAENALRAQIEGARATDGGTAVAVDFAYDLSKRDAPKSKTGYEWVCDTVFTDEADTDPVAAVRHKIDNLRKPMRAGVETRPEPNPDPKGPGKAK